MFKVQCSMLKAQAPSLKPQASSPKSQVSSLKPQAYFPHNGSRIMPSYIARLERLAPEDQEVEIEEQIERTYKDIVQGSGFRDVMARTNAWNWAIDECNILEMAMGDGEVRVKLSYLASGENAEKEIEAAQRGTIRGEAEAVVNDEGEVRYEAVTGELLVDSNTE
jgi:hypothetical protein